MSRSHGASFRSWPLAVACILAAAAGAGWPVPASAQSTEAPAPQARIEWKAPEPQSVEEQIIRKAYQRHEAYSEYPTQDVSFALSEFETIPRSRFDEIFLVDVATLPDGDLIDATVGETTLWGTDVDYAYLELAWRTVEERQWGTSDAGMPIENVKLSEGLREAKQENTGLAEVEALTTYRVTVSLQGRERTYRAAFLWIDEGDGEFRAQVLDHITQGVEEAMVAALPSLEEARQTAESKPRVVTSEARVTAQTHNSCAYSNEGIGQVAAGKAGSNGHVTGGGFHRAGVGGYVQCVCSESCNQTCNIVITGSQCSEDAGSNLVWTEGGCHRVDQQQKEGFSALQNAGGGLGAACAGGFACAQQACFGCLCSTAISISVIGSGVSFNYSGGPDWTWDKPIGGQCAGCDSSGISHSDECSTSGSTAGGGLGRITAGLFNDCTGDGRTPIVIDLQDSGLQFTSAAGGVNFDLDADGVPERVAWTTVESDLSFLVMDANRNGWIDGGQELFGDRSVQPRSGDGDEHGYRTLLWFDEVESGGNGDGLMSSADLVWQRLMLWHDRNHNGVSEPSELTRIDSTAIESIDLDYQESRRRDRYGNELRYRSPIRMKEDSGQPGIGRHKAFSFDVLFVVQASG